VALVLVALLGVTFAGLGRFLAHEDPLQKADAIVVLAGSLMERPLEAADLYIAGWAPRIVMTYGPSDPAVAALATRGVILPSEEDLARDALIKAGVPPAAFIVPARRHDNTAQEAQTISGLVREHGWRRVIVVSSKFHLRRAGFAFRRELGDTSVEVLMHGSRYDEANPARWWASRSDLRWMLSEGPKLIAYVLGLSA
jgi:uncharacterized SAM-binding protein YcdF (DUF218 family)